jgi:acetyl-CoA synthetase
VIVSKRTGGACNMVAGRDVWWDDACAGQSDVCEPEWVDAEHPLFLLYTSGSTGKPKGVQHSSGGYLLHAILTMKWTFDIKPDDIFWCTADIGWVTGHTYITYGPLACGATEIVFEGVPTYPDAGRFWKTIQTHKVNVFYTAPTAIRSLIKAGDATPTTHPKNYDLSSLRILGSVGEPINPEAWMWYYDNVGGSRCPIVDTFWQTETGGHMITPLPGVTPLVPGSCTLPFPGIQAAIVDETGADVPWGNGGFLVVKKPWPAMIRNIWGDPSASRSPTTRPTSAASCTWPATARCATPRPATSPSWAASTTCSTSPATAWAPWKSNRRWSPTRWWRKPPWSAVRMT